MGRRGFVEGEHFPIAIVIEVPVEAAVGFDLSGARARRGEEGEPAAGLLLVG